MNRVNRSGLSLGVMLLSLSLPACADPDTTATDTSLFDGRVLEAGTNKPIPGAIVLGRWTEVRSVWPADTQDVCVHVESTTSDKDGRFRLPRYHGRNPTLFDSYKVGYEAYRFDTTEAYSRQQSWLQRSTAGREERLKYLSFGMISGTSCHGAGASYKNLYWLRRAVYEEAVGLAETPEEKALAQRIRELADDTLINREKPTKYDERGRLINVNPRDTFRPEDLK